MAKVYVRMINLGKRSPPAEVDDGDEIRELERQGKVERLNAEEIAKLAPPPAPKSTEPAPAPESPAKG